MYNGSRAHVEFGARVASADFAGILGATTVVICTTVGVRTKRTA